MDRREWRQTEDEIVRRMDSREWRQARESWLRILNPKAITRSAVSAWETSVGNPIMVRRRLKTLIMVFTVICHRRCMAVIKHKPAFKQKSFVLHVSFSCSDRVVKCVHSCGSKSRWLSTCLLVSFSAAGRVAFKCVHSGGSKFCWLSTCSHARFVHPA